MGRIIQKINSVDQDWYNSTIVWNEPDPNNFWHKNSYLAQVKLFKEYLKEEEEKTNLEKKYQKWEKLFN